MKQWEYLNIKCSLMTDASLNFYGNKGWELVTIKEYSGLTFYIFKRIKE